ncbi:MAG TPA: hypothetical protein DIU00_23830 [Phycisphaerales bacterium]|nr:hypothetical protein [Phycisphaerales bacterium]
MKWLDGYRMRLLLVGFMAAIVIGGGNAKADFTFGVPTNLGPVVNSQYDEQMPSISADGLELYFMSRRPGGVGDWDIWIARRETIHDPWTEPANIGSTVNRSGEDWAPCISADGLELYFEANRLGGHGGTDIWMAVRETIDKPWGDPVNLGATVNSSERDGGPSVSADGLELYFKSRRPGGYAYEDLWVSKRPTKDDLWGNPVNLGPTVNGPDSEREPSISADGLALFFASDRFNAAGGWDPDIWLTRRKTKDSAWGEPINLGPSINTTYWDDAPSISADGLTLYFSDYYGDGRPGDHGGADLYQVSVIPIVDLNGDGIVDAEDMCIMVDHWGMDEPLCDIGPMPWGDGTVDIEDLKVLAEHLFEEAYDPALIAHWALDETDGMFAVDSAGDNDAVVVGGATWQPDGGKIDGALQLDGIDGYGITGAILNPADDPFSVYVWIKDGVPGQVFVSQQAMANWLTVDAEGNLMTELKCTGRSAGPLYSETVITDGQWHRIGLVWDGSNRTLYVDGVAVADDIQPGLEGSQMGLYIGTGKAMEPGTYFSGLIDDVRIYNRAVSP